MSLTVRAKYERGVLRLLENVNLRDGEEVIVIIRRKPNIERFIGVLGKASVKELEAYEGEVYSP